MKRESALRQVIEDLAQVEPDSARSDRAIDRALQVVRARSQAATSLPGQPRYILRRSALAVCTLCGMLLLFSWLAGVTSNKHLLFAQALHRATETNSVTYTELNWATNKEGYRGPKTETKVSILGKHSERREQRTIAEGEKLPEGQGWFPQPEHYISIFDAQTGKLVALSPEQKTFRLAKTLMSITGDGQIERNEVKPLPKANFYDRMRNVPVEDAERLPPKKIGDTCAIGYRLSENVKKKSGTDTWTRTYWVDPNSMLPIRIDVTHKSTDPRTANSVWIQRDIKFNVHVDESLFSTEVPEGYTDITEKP